MRFVKHISAIFVLVVACLSALPLHAADPASVQDIKEYFIAHKRNRDIENFEALVPEHRKKLLNYFQAGKAEQKDERTLLKGVVNYLSLLTITSKASRQLREFQKTGVLAEDIPENFSRYLRPVIDAFPSASNYVDEKTVHQLDAAIGDIYKEQNAQTDARIAQIQKLINALSK